jgi:hypothetical protein
LIDSHYMPRALYKLARDEKFKNPHPVLIGEETARISSRQASDYFLCATCEDRFSKGGEAWVQGHCWRDKKTFALRGVLLAATPIPGSDAESKIYMADALPAVECERLAYFAASVFWRGAARDWTFDGEELPRLDFGTYAEELRQYLLNQAPFPTKAALFVHVSAGMESMRNNLIWFPRKISGPGSFIYRFRIPGITFLLVLGNRALEYRDACIVNGKGRPIFMMDDVDKWNFADAARHFAGSTRVGALKQRLATPGATPPRWSQEEIRNLLPRRK